MSMTGQKRLRCGRVARTGSACTPIWRTAATRSSLQTRADFRHPSWPDLTHAKIFRLSFRDKGRLIDSVDHPLFQKWASKDKPGPK